MENQPKTEARLLEPVSTVGELIKQLQQLDEHTPFAFWQQLQYVKFGPTEWVCFVEKKDTE